MNTEITLSSPMEVIPSVSESLLAPIIRKVKRAPAPGYDIKTMKKEASYFENEFNDLIEYLNLLRKQNVELIMYMKTIVNINKHNAQVSRLQINALHVELKIIHDEILLLQKYDNHSDYHDNNKNKIINNNEYGIDYNKIDEILMMADSSSLMPMISDEVRTIAFTKLRVVIREKILLNNIEKVLGNFYHKRVLSFGLHGWKRYINSKALGLKLENKIHKKVQCQIMKQWKMLTSNKTIANTNIKKRGLKIWMARTRWGSWSMHRANIFRNKRYVGPFFQAWRSQCTFLDWQNLIVATRYNHAGSYFMTRIFNWFKKAVAYSKYEEEEKIWNIGCITKRKCYRIWLSSCEKKWQRRGQLINTFFTNVRSLVSTKHRILHFKREAVRFWSGYNKLQVLHTWTHMLRYKSKQICQNKYRKAMKWCLMNIFARFKHVIGICNMMRKSRVQAIHEYNTFSKRHGFCILRLNYCIKRKRRWKCDSFLLKKFTNRWKKFMSSIGDFNKMNSKVASYRKKRNVIMMKSIFDLFYSMYEKRNRYNRYQKIIAWKTNKFLLSSYFKYMSCTWSSRLYKKRVNEKFTAAAVKERSEEMIIKRQTLLLESETKRKLIHDYEGKIVELQGSLSENKIAINQAISTIQQDKILMDNLSEEYENKLEMIASVIQEHYKYKNVDHMMSVRKMYEDMKRDAVDHTVNKNLDDSTVDEEKSMTSYDDNTLDNDINEESETVKNFDYDIASMKNTYDIASRSIHRIADKLKKKVMIE